MRRKSHHPQITRMSLIAKAFYILSALLVYIRVEYLINFRKLEHYYGLIENENKLNENQTPLHRITWIQRVRKTINFISPLIPKKHYCLSRVLIGRILLAEKSISTNIEFNMEYSDEEKITAHSKLKDNHSDSYVFN